MKGVEVVGVLSLLEDAFSAVEAISFILGRPLKKLKADTGGCFGIGGGPGDKGLEDL